MANMVALLILAPAYAIYKKIGYKMTRHGANMGKLMEKIEKVYLEYLYPYKVWWCLFS